MDYQQFLDLARSPPVRALLRETISPHLKPDRRAIVYPLGLTNRIGHLAPEPHYFSTLFAGDYEQLILLTSPQTTKGVNQALYDLLAEQFTMVETDQEILLRLGLLNDGVVSEQGFDICLSLPVRFYREYVMRRAGGTELQFLKLTDDLRDRGAAWFNELGLKPDQPFVALHVRDPSYVPQVEYQEHGDMRSASLDNYVAAVDWLADQGFAVFRLGDREAKPLRRASPMVFDLPFMARHESWMDVFFCGACTFSVNCQSGPEALVRAF
ncbi:MAG: TIGR04372 family glycosyltransferase, partial [Alphaproteobacteria bacterium]|nr:TIGR04372 family glycosyltransferase [Alphaproteobacteria bacterium]